MHGGRHYISELDRKGLRDFAFVTGGIVAGIFGLNLPWIFESGLPVWPWVVFGILGAWGLLLPGTLRPVYRAWMRFGILMSHVTTPLIMGLTFYLVITPVGVVRRIVGNDPMRRELNDSESYRLPSSKTSVENLRRPF